MATPEDRRKLRSRLRKIWDEQLELQKAPREEIEIDGKIHEIPTEKTLKRGIELQRERNEIWAMLSMRLIPSL